MSGIRPKRTAASVADHIEGLIREGTLRPGEQLRPERELAERLSVSRPTLRDGMRLLQDRGVLSSEPGGPTRVAQVGSKLLDPIVELLAFRAETIGDYFEFRKSVEATAAHLAAGRATEADLNRIQACMRRIDAAHRQENIAEEAAADADLHVSIYEASHNIVLLHVMQAFSGMLRAGMFYSREQLYERVNIRAELRDQHWLICETVTARDPAAARSAVEQHIDYTQRALRDVQAAGRRLDLALRRASDDRLTVERQA